MVLDHWLKWVEKSFSKFLSQVQRMNVASSNSLLALKVALENTMLFLSFQIDHVSANHHPSHVRAFSFKFTILVFFFSRLSWFIFLFGSLARSFTPQQRTFTLQQPSLQIGLCYLYLCIVSFFYLF